MRLSLLRQVSVIALLILSACQTGESPTLSMDDVDFAHQAADMAVDDAVTYGKLPNGVRYAVRANATPTQTASLLMRIDTGSLNETEATRGIAHFLEHMAFNGSENIPESEMTKRLERFGLAFGADTNASTSFDETIYQLELPDVGEEILNETLMIMRETADRLLLAPDAIDRERGVIQAERRARSNPGFRAFLDQLDFFVGHTILPERLPIGTEATIDTVTPEQFRAFYEGYYRPENTFITLVGDIEPDYAAQKIAEYFSDWDSASDIAALPSFEIETAALTQPRARVYTDPEIQTSVSVSVVKAAQDRQDSVKTRKDVLIEGLGNAMLNRRLGKLARSEAAQFISASVGTSNFYDAAEISSLSVSAQPENWEAALGQGEQALRQAREFGFAQAELDEQLANYENALKVAVQTSPTRRTSGLAQEIMSSFSGEVVLTTPELDLEQFLAAKPDITLKSVKAAFDIAWEGLDAAPQLYLATSAIIEDGEVKLRDAYAAAKAVPVTARADDVTQTFAYTDFGEAGTVRSKTLVEDLEATLIEFDNNVRLTIKKTPYEDNIIRLSARIGAGTLALPLGDAPGMEIYMPNMLTLSGLGQHSVDELRSVTAGRSVGVGRGFGDDVMTLSGATTPDDLQLQLQLMAAYATDPGFRPEAQAQYDKYIRSWYPTLDSTPGGVGSRDIPRILRSGDPRFGLPSEAAMLDVDFDRIRTWMSDYVDGQAIEITAVGDIDPEKLIAAVGETFGALPKRAAKPYVPSASLTALEFPKGTSRSIKLTHAGDAETAGLRLYWPAPDASDVQRARRTQIMSSMFELALTEQLREIEGATYSPGVSQYNSRLYPGYGYIGAQLEVSPDKADLMAQRIRETAAKFAAGDIDPDLFDRAMKPILEYLETSLESNGSWMSVLSRAQSDPESLERFRSRDTSYQNMTLDDVLPVAKQVFDPKSAVEIQILPAL